MRSAPRGAGGPCLLLVSRPARLGYSNAALAALIGLVALVGLLGLVASGQVDFISLFSPPPEIKAEKSKKKKKTTPPALVPPEAVIPFTAAVTPPATPIPSVAESLDTPRYTLDPQRELVQALGRMDGKAAGEMLSFMDPETVTELLMQLRERDLARILEYAPAADAALWVESIDQAVKTAEAQRQAAQAAAETAATTEDTPPETEDTDETATAEATEEAGAADESAPAEEAEAASTDGQPAPSPDTNTA